jgi:hypothetical protein
MAALLAPAHCKQHGCISDQDLAPTAGPHGICSLAVTQQVKTRKACEPAKPSPAPENGVHIRVLVSQALQDEGLCADAREVVGLMRVHDLVQRVPARPDARVAKVGVRVHHRPVGAVVYVQLQVLEGGQLRGDQLIIIVCLVDLCRAVLDGPEVPQVLAPVQSTDLIRNTKLNLRIKFL